MTSTFDSSEYSNHIEVQVNDIESSLSALPISSNDIYVPSTNSSVQKVKEHVPAYELTETVMTSSNTNHSITDTDTTSGNSANMVTAEASFTDATSADLPIGAIHSSVARVLVKPGQIFRVQVDNEVKEVHGKFIYLV